MFSGRSRTKAFGLPLLVASLGVLSSFGWGACEWAEEVGGGKEYGSSGSCPTDLWGACEGLFVPPSDGSCYYGKKFAGWKQSLTPSCGGFYHRLSCYYQRFCCDSQVEADSVTCLNAGNLWIDNACCDEQCVCEKNGGQWIDGACNTCNDHVPMPDRCEELWQSGYNVDGEGNAGGGGYWAIVTYECFYDSCAMSLNCQEKSNFPAGSLNCGDFMDSTGTTGRCVGVVGFQCVMQCGTVTKNCDCDGSCQKALDSPDCACPKSSSSSGDSSSSSDGSSSSGDSSSSSDGSSSSGDSSSSSDGGGPASSGGDWEYNYHPQLDEIISLNKSQVGYLSDIDRMVANINANGLKVDVSSLEASVTAGTDAQKAGNDTLHSIHGTLDSIDSALTQEVETPDISDWITSATSVADELYSKARDTTTIKVHIDSVKADTSNFKSKYSGLFISNAYTREGCYTFTIKDSGFMGRVGHKFKLGASVNFGDLGGWDLCAILRGVVRAIGAILCLLITIKAYRSAFSSSDG